MSPLALSGLASGLDTETIIAQLMSVERAPRTRMALQDTQALSRQTQLKDIQTRLTSLRSAATALRDATTFADVQAISSSDPTRIGVSSLGSVAPGSHTLEVTQLATAAQHAFAYTTSASAQSLTIGSFTLAVDPDTTVGTLASAINARDDSPVKAVVAGGKLVLTSRATGASNFTVDATPLLTEDAGRARAGVNAIYAFDGVAQTPSASNVITDAVLGLEVTLKGTTAGPVTVNVGDPAPDSAAIKSKVTAFVNAYNNAVDIMRDKLGEKPVAGATSSANAVKGLFNGDSLLGGMLASMRSSIGDLADLGISTGKASGTAKFSQDAVDGHLSIDDAALTAAIKADPTGLATRVKDMAARVTAVVAPAAGSPIDTRLGGVDATRKRLADSMAAIDVRLAAKEKGLRAKFSAMESALAAAQASQAQMTAQLGSLR